MAGRILLKSRRYIVIVLAALLCFSTSGCNRGESRANTLFSQASEAVSKAKLFQDSHPEDALVLYEDAREKIEVIYAEYHDTIIAKQLQNGSATLDGQTVKEIRSTTIPKLQLMLKSSLDPMQLVQALIPQVPSALSQAQLAQLLAERLIHAHRPDEALQQIKVALREIDSIGSLPDQIAILLKLAINYNDLGIKDKTLEVTFRALALAKQLPAPEARQQILSEIAFTYYRAGAEQKGLEAIRSIQDNRHEQDSLRKIAERLAQENLFSEAFLVTRALRDAPGKALYLAQIASQAVEKDLCEPAKLFIEGAVKLSDTFSDSNDEARFWLTVATLYHRCGKDAESLAVLDKAVHASGEGAHNVNYAETASLIGALASSYVELGQSDTALSLIASALPIAQKEKGQTDRDKVFSEIATTLAALGEFERSEKVLSSVKGAAELARASVAIARRLHAAGKDEKALALLTSVKSAIGQVSNPDERTALLLLLRDCYFDMKRLNDALEVGFLLREYSESWRKHIRTLNEQLVSHGEISLALRLAREINDPYLGGVLLADIARFQAKHGSLNEAVALMEEAFRMTRSGSDQKRGSAMTQYFAEALLLMKWPKEAYDLVNANDLPNKSLWYARIAALYSELGKQEAASDTLAQALVAAEGLKPLESQIQTLVEVASAYSLTGIQPDQKSQQVLRRIFQEGTK